MTNNEILKADVLDILFANRNKAYGAYLLRKTYPQRLLFSTGMMALFAAGIFGFLAGNSKYKQVLFTEAPDLVVLTEVNMPEPPADVPKPPPAAVPARPAELVKTRDFTSTIEIVPDLQVPETEVPPVSDLANAVIGTDNIEGPAFEGGQQPPNPAPVQNTSTVAAPAEQEFYESMAVDQMAEFPGGAGAFQRYLASRLPQPEGLDVGESKTVKVRFVIEKDGSIDNIFVVQSGGAVLDRAVVQVLKKAPRWKAAVHRGRTVAVVFTQPVTFVGSED